MTCEVPSLKFDRCCCAVLTPIGRGAIATVAVWGPNVKEIVSRRFSPASGKPLQSSDPGRVVFGRFQVTSEAGEELVVGLTSEGEIEIHCHGGAAAVNAICQALRAEGCHLVSAAHWARHSAPDPLAAAALVVLGSTRTERTAAILLDQYRGALGHELTGILQWLNAGKTAQALNALEKLLSRAELGLHLIKPWRIVLAGRPNAGKSSLINAIVGYQRSIVHEEPGTTRDLLTATTAIDGWLVELVDSAGLRAAADEIEAEGVAMAQEAIGNSDLVLLVSDVTQAWDATLCEELTRNEPACSWPPLVVHNKCDLIASEIRGRPPGIAVSALTGSGIDQLCAEIARRLVPSPPSAGDAVPFTSEQLTLLRQAAAALEDNRPALALDHLGNIVSAIAP